ncbi:MAG: hypothetical protein HC852_21170 [Acaryochloridaceae cyanobacterium RU_4_10]|nr:hypothetical protein [Acaryochloridaceae cyanobacterium RU_4_10]
MLDVFQTLWAGDRSPEKRPNHPAQIKTAIAASTSPQRPPVQWLMFRWAIAFENRFYFL